MVQTYQLVHGYRNLFELKIEVDTSILTGIINYDGGYGRVPKKSSKPEEMMETAFSLGVQHGKQDLVSKIRALAAAGSIGFEPSKVAQTVAFYALTPREKQLVGKILTNHEQNFPPYAWEANIFQAQERPNKPAVEEIVQMLSS